MRFSAQHSHSLTPPEERRQACFVKKNRWKWQIVFVPVKERGYKKIGRRYKKKILICFKCVFSLATQLWGEAWETIVIQLLNLKFNLWTPLQRSVSRELLFRQNKAIKTEHGWNYCGVKPAKLLFWAQHFYPPPKKKDQKKIKIKIKRFYSFALKY